MEQNEQLSSYLADHAKKDIPGEDIPGEDLLKKRIDIAKMQIPYTTGNYDFHFLGEHSVESSPNDIHIRYRYCQAVESGINYYQRYLPGVQSFYLKGLNIYRETSEKEKKVREISLDQIAPSCKVFFDPRHIYSSGCAPEAGIIYIGMDINSAAGLLTLAHEGGHVIDYRSHDRKDRLARLELLKKKIENEESLSPQEEEDFIRGERNAWAIGLRNLSGLIGLPNTPGGICSIAQAKDMIHNDCLASHYRGLIAYRICTVACKEAVEDTGTSEENETAVT